MTISFSHSLLKKIAAWLGFLLALPILAVFLLWVWLQTETGLATLAAYLERYLSTTENSITLGPVTGHFPADIAVGQIVVKDKQGVETVRIDNARLRWSPITLLHDVIKVQQLSADNVVITPVTTSSSSSSVDVMALLSHWPRMHVEDIALKTLALNSGENHFRYHIYGGLAPGKVLDTLTSSFHMETLEGPASRAHIAVRINPKRKFLSLKATLEEEPGGGIGTLAGLPADEGFALHLEGKGPFKHWQGNYDFALSDAPLVTGEITLMTEEKKLAVSLDGAITVPKRFMPASASDWLAPGEPIGFSLDAAFLENQELHIPAILLATSRHQLHFAGQRIAGQLEGIASGTLTSPVAMQAFLGKSTNFAMQVMQNPDRVMLSNIYSSLAQGQLTGNTSITLANKAVEGTLVYNYADNLKAESHFSGTADDMMMDIAVDGTNLKLSGFTLPSLQSTFTLRHFPKASEGDIKLMVNDGKQRYQLYSSFTADARYISLQKLQLTAPAMKFEGGVTFDIATRLLQGEITGGGSFAALKPFLRQDIGGKLQLKASATPVKGKQEAALSLKTTGLTVNMLTLAQADMSLQLKDIFTAPAAEAILQLKGLSAGSLEAKTVSLKAQGDAKKIEFSGNGQMIAQAPLQFATKGTIALEKGSVTLALQELAGSYNKRPFKLLKTATLKTSPTETTLSEMLMNYAKADARLIGRYTPRATDITLQVSDLALADLPLGTSAAFRGKTNGKFTITGTSASPVARLSVILSGLGSTSEKIKLPPFQLQTESELKEGFLTSTATLSAGSEKQAEARVRFPVAFSLSPYRLRIPPEGALNGQVNAAIDAKLLNAMFAPDVTQRVAGKLEANCQLKGTLAHPELQGGARIVNASYEHDLFGVVLQNINAELKASGKLVTLVNASLTDGDKGRASASGSINIASLSSPININLLLNKFYLLHRDSLNMRAQGNASITGSLQAPVLGGNIAIDRANIIIPDRIPPSITQLNTTRINVPPALKEIPKSPSKGGSSSLLDLKLVLDFPNRVYLRGQGLDTELSGKLTITGNAADPLINGALHTVRGRYQFAGQGFELTSGTASFRGAVPPSPFLDITAEAPADDITAQVHFTGTLDTPKIVITSTPPMPQDEVLSRLLFGKNLKTISPTQAYRLVSVTRQMMGGGSESNMLDRVRGMLRLDDLDIKQDDQGSSAVGVGKYIQKGVYVGAQKNLTTNGGKANVEINLTRHITLESEIGSVTKDLGTPAAQTNTEEGIGLNWKYDY